MQGTFDPIDSLLFNDALTTPGSLFQHGALKVPDSLAHIQRCTLTAVTRSYYTMRSHSLTRSHASALSKRNDSLHSYDALSLDDSLPKFGALSNTGSLDDWGALEIDDSLS
jgi:hypothetical protein